MKSYKFDGQRGQALKNQLTEFMGQLSLSDIMNLSQQLQNDIERKAEVHFASAAYYKMLALIEECDKEIAWDGIVYRDETNSHIFHVTDVIVYPQEVSGATVETDDEKYLEWLNSLDDETFNHRRFNGHSHVRMGVTPSSVDTTYREQSVRNIPDFFIFGIFNKNGAFNFQIYDIENNLIYDNDDITFYTPEPDYSTWAKEVIKEQVAVKKYTYQSTTTAAKSGTTNTSVSGSTNANTNNSSYLYQQDYKGTGYSGRSGYSYPDYHDYVGL